MPPSGSRPPSLPHLWAWKGPGPGQPRSARSTSPMNWYYSDGSQPQGPFPQDEWSALVASGIVKPDTLVWREGMPGWVPLAEAMAASTGPVPSASDASPAPTADVAPGVPCAGCGSPCPPEDLVDLAGYRVCAACKPAVLQRLREGASTASLGIHGDASQDTLSEEEVLARDYEVPVSESAQAGFTELFRLPGTLLLGGVLLSLVLIACNLVPYLGVVASFFLQGPLIGGLLLAYLGHLRGKRMEVGDAFQGFGPRFWPLFRAQVVPGLLAGLAYLPAALVGIPMLVLGGFTGAAAGNVGFPVLAIGAFFALLLGGAIVQSYLSVSWTHTMLLVADRGYRVLPAMKLSRRLVAQHFWQHLWLTFFLGILTFLGFLVCFVGIFVAMPATLFAKAFVYQRLWKGLRHAEDQAR